MTNYTHAFTPFKARILWSSFLSYQLSESRQANHTRMTGRARFAGHIETKHAHTLHNKMIYHFCTKRFAALPFWLRIFCFDLLKTVFFSSFCFVCSSVPHPALIIRTIDRHRHHHHLRSAQFRISTAKRIHCHKQRTRIITKIHTFETDCHWRKTNSFDLQANNK